MNANRVFCADKEVAFFAGYRYTCYDLNGAMLQFDEMGLIVDKLYLRLTIAHLFFRRALNKLIDEKIK